MPRRKTATGSRKSCLAHSASNARCRQLVGSAARTPGSSARSSAEMSSAAQP
eukprot:CAMPEP_0180038784 /NCGR_PEP_ID=MMETSP0984-20121128/32405_1 /TAXON_ID=483367 /ORGANISM="non described non described, Strain CCMP 2436" /LENGTH=51 /DNA_ID=CAMNT_0021965569 /DNA_START=114 /DNA_END=266 /DNA_ORIENTATION=-